MRANPSVVAPFDKVYRFYDAYMHIFGFYREKLIARLLNLQGTESVVDLGGGTGYLSSYLSGMCGELFLIDESRGMLSEVKKSDSINIFKRDVLDTGFSDRRFDIAILSDLVHHVEDQEGLLMECSRILRPDGRVLIYDFDIGYLRTKMSRWFEERLFGKVYFRRRVEVENMLKSLGFSRIDGIARGYWYIIIWRKREAR
ncbi:methyltransferase domain-containing protein [candidate division WOR-3 bacterium]|uniref:Methyltransferase domain-containing protein n=1 Tax=candidate division WOR-3 bacterium TaxID=2052148 RepID=A0A9D5QCQ2_UNCW3|nr:methyltransferase domain-containing protein [candidate division WOR-3 bacterium]MBD3364799.1 methyltransferase domain-containing protein [candidate division WOR-3 bacterium]